MTGPPADEGEGQDLRLADRVAALEERAGAAGSLESRIAWLEHSLRRLRFDPDELASVEASIAASSELVRSHVAPGKPVGILTHRDPELLAMTGRPIVPLRIASPGGRPGELGQVASAMAMLAAARARGLRHVLLTSEALGGGSEPLLREHLLDRFVFVSEAEEAGVLLELTPQRADAEGAAIPSLSEALDRVSGGDHHVPVLDWTDLDLARILDGRTVFTPPSDDDGRLPYLDESVALVVIDDPSRIEEARRVATLATIGVRGDADGGLEVVDVDAFDRAAGAEAVEVFVAAGPAGTEQVDQAVGYHPDVPIRAVADPASEAVASEAEIAVVLEPGVLPLPGCLAALAATLDGEPEVGAAGAKLLAANGPLEGAGTMVFSDGSVAGVAAGSWDVAAAWHEFARPVCAGTGLLALRPAAARSAGAASRSPLGLAADIWRSGLEVRYQPDAWAVRAWPADQGSGSGADDAGDGAERWAPALPHRPQRPLELDAAAWRSLLAREDIRGSWR